MVRSTMHTPAWSALSTNAQALYPHLKLEWKGPQHNNNGKVMLSVRQAARLLGVSMTTANKAFHDLQAKGFVVVTKLGCPGLDGSASGHQYEITEIVLPGDDKRPRRLYKDWRPKNDYDVRKGAANNPQGKNGK